MQPADSSMIELKQKLGCALAERDADGVARAVGAMACGSGASAFARRSGLAREGLHRLVREGGNLRMTTLFRALKELNIDLHLDDGSWANRVEAQPER